MFPLDLKCLDLPRPLGAALGLISILVMFGIQAAFLTVKMAQGIVFGLFMPVGPLAMSWVVNHLYATPLGIVSAVHPRPGALFPRHFPFAALYDDLPPMLAPCPHPTGCQVHVWVFRLYQRFVGPSMHSQPVRRDFSVGPRSGRAAVHSVACLLDNYAYIIVDLEGSSPHACCVVRRRGLWGHQTAHYYDGARSQPVAVLLSRE